MILGKNFINTLRLDSKSSKQGSVLKEYSVNLELKIHRWKNWSLLHYTLILKAKDSLQESHTVLHLGLIWMRCLWLKLIRICHIDLKIKVKHICVDMMVIWLVLSLLFQNLWKKYNKYQVIKLSDFYSNLLNKDHNQVL